MQIHFLKAAISLTKTYERLPDKTIRKTSYPHVFNVTSITENPIDLKQFADLLIKHSKLGHCLVKGALTHTLNNESRAGSTNTLDETDYIVLDIDGLASVKDVDTVLDELGFSGYSYIVQVSASYGVENDYLRCHVFLQLDKPVPAPTLKQWLMHLNLNVKVLNEALKLTRTGNALRWPLDISACQNDKLIYIAPPVFKNMKDPVVTPRIKYVRKAKQKLPTASINPVPEAIKEATAKKLNELRVGAGLPKRKDVFKTQGTIEYLTKPGNAMITEMKTERGFVYFNLNGGDSWAYYHPEGHPEFIYNFKDEPLYKTSELLPDYWKEIEKTITQTSHQGAQNTNSGIVRLAFCDAKSSVYYRGYYDPALDYLELNAAKNETILRDFAKQYGMPLGDFIPEWNYTFDPALPVRVDQSTKTINTFQPTIYMRKGAALPRLPSPPKTIMKVIENALGGDKEIVDHFINWLAFILQRMECTRTAWVLHGTTATGKGVLMNNILRPLFGMAHTTVRRMEELNEQYNHFMQSTFIVFVDEVQTKVLNNEKGVMAKLKNFITEPTISIRRMYANAIEVLNYTNWIFASNMPDPVAIDREDRRFNVGKYQPHSIQLTAKDMANIEKELQAFHDYLLTYPMDVQRAHTPLNNIDRANMMSISENSADSVARALIDGRFDFFIENLPTSDRPAEPRQQDRINEYKHVLISIIDRTMRSGQCAIARDELYAMFNYLVGGIPESPNKFTSYLKHHRIHTSAVWVKTKTVNGIKVTWDDISQFAAHRAALTPSTVGPNNVVQITKKKRTK